jgi:Rieske Fe-S protein
MAESEPPPQPPSDHPNRRGFIASTSTIAMVGGLVAGYGPFAGMAARYLYPSGSRPMSWLFVTEVARVEKGGSLEYQAPTGEKIAVARMAENGTADDFIALSSTCPHLGCQVHWESQNDRFFCPCHNGVFDPVGKGVSGPPGDAGQDLPRYELKVENDLLFIHVPTDALPA